MNEVKLLVNPRIAFFHVPKTGGQWVMAALHNGEVDCSEMKVHYGPMGLRDRHVVPEITRRAFRNRFKFCFVRRPYPWYRSYWCYRALTNHRDKQFPLDQLLGGTFEEWLELILHEYPEGFLTKMYREYTPGMNFVGRTERLADHLCAALSICKEPYDEGKLRATPPVNLASALPEYGDRAVASAELIARINAADHKVLEKYYAR
jgi:hypothetical protein